MSYVADTTLLTRIHQFPADISEDAFLSPTLEPFIEKARALETDECCYRKAIVIEELMSISGIRCRFEKQLKIASHEAAFRALKATRVESFDLLETELPKTIPTLLQPTPPPQTSIVTAIVETTMDLPTTPKTDPHAPCCVVV